MRETYVREGGPKVGSSDALYVDLQSAPKGKVEHVGGVTKGVVIHRICVVPPISNDGIFAPTNGPCKGATAVAARECLRVSDFVLAVWVLAIAKSPSIVDQCIA